MRGRLPRSQHVADLTNDHNRRGQTEPDPGRCQSLLAPDYLDDIAKAEWVRTTGILATMRMLTEADRSLLELYCGAYSRYRQAEAAISRDGLVVKAKRTGVPQLNPWNSILNKAADQMRRYIEQLGLTPVGRARLRQDRENDAENKTIEERYLRSG